MDNQYDVFISYSRKDALIVDEIVSKLEQQKFRIWIDKNGIESGDAFKKVIVKAIDKSTCVLFFSSKNANLSEWTAKEIGVAVYENKHIIPILLDKSKYNLEVKFDLINLDYIDYTDPQTRPEMFVKLLKALSIKCNKVNKLNDINNAATTENIESSVWHILTKKYLSQFLTDIRKRNVLVNFILISLQVLAILSLIPGISSVLWSISLFESPQWSFSEVYGKGYIPGFLMSIFIVISNGLTLRGSRNGIYLLFISFVVIFIPMIWNEFEEFIYFSIFSLIGIITYMGVLFIPHNGASVWKLCKLTSTSLRYLGVAAIVIWAFILVMLPPIMSKAIGFSNDLYRNGMIVIDARCNGSVFYTKQLANKMAFTPNSKDILYFGAEEWYKKAIYDSEHEYSDYRVSYSKINCYVDYIYFLAKYGRKSDAIDYMQKAIERFGLSSLQKEIENDSDEYDRNAYRFIVLRYLSTFIE